MQTKERNSSLELLRIFCIIGIVIMHTCGPMMNEARGVNLIWVQLENGAFSSRSVYFYFDFWIFWY